MLIFGADGQSVTDKVSLHSHSAMVVYPADATLVDPATGRAIPTLSDRGPCQWELWQYVEVELRDVFAVQVRRGGEAGQVRSASAAAPAADDSAACPSRWCSERLRHPVHSGGPVAVFPPTLSGLDEAWRVVVTQFQGYGEFTTEAVMAYDLEVPAAGGEVEILTDDDYPWLGEFVVRLVNPRGRSFQKHFAIAEQAELMVTSVRAAVMASAFPPPRDSAPPRFASWQARSR